MTKYIEEEINKLNALKNGMTLNPALWVGQPVTPAMIDAAVADLLGQDQRIETSKDQLQQFRTGGRQKVETYDTGIAAKVINLAVGLHNNDPQKLNEYDIHLRQPGQPLPIPPKAIIAFMRDDDDGIGFKIKVQPLADASAYEWEKGQAPQPNQLVLAPPYTFWRTSSKTQLVDDDVEKGIRYFYRVRAINATGAGEWSEPVSHVQ